MEKKAGKASHGLRWGILSLAAAVAVVSVSTDPADALVRRKKPTKAAASSYTPPYADIVVDGNSGTVMHSTNPDSPRHPASLTKIMTLYMLFEQLEAGNVGLKTEFPVSTHASVQAPSKLGLKPGQTITVEDAIRATVTRSANDVAVVIAEGLGGTEESFAKQMTAKARALGMQNTLYRNASGLPDDQQITTARDQALLGRAIQDRFPKYYAYFSTTRFFFRGNTIGNHNRLLGKVEGVDGIKTGYTNASGFNLVTSMRRSGRHIVAVVLGGRSASSRDDKMRSLVNEYVRTASTQRTAPVLAENTSGEPKRNVAQRIAAAVITPARAEVAPAATGGVPMPRPAPVAAPAAAPVPQAQVAAAPLSLHAAGVAPGSSDPLEPVMVKTLSVRPGSAQNVAAAPATTASVPPIPARSQTLAFADPAPETRQPGVLGVLTMKAQPAPAMPAATQQVKEMEAAPSDFMRPVTRSGWIIQVGAFDREDDAKSRVATAQARAKSFLSAADGFTERVVKDNKTLYRARFAGLEKDQAEAACQYLKKNEIACMALKN